MPDNSIDAVVTDPPYGHNNNNGDLISRWEAACGRGEYKPEVNNRPIANDGIEANDLYRAMIRETFRVLKPGSCCCCCCAGGGGPDPQFAKWSLWMDELYDFKQMVIWDKGPIGMGWHYRRSYETVLVGQKRGAACKWYDDSHRIENIIRPGQYGIRKIIPKRHQHPTLKPVELFIHFIKLHTTDNDIVLDPFMGSGTCGVAAIKMNRRFIGCEIDSEYYQIAKARIHHAAQDGTMYETIHE